MDPLLFAFARHLGLPPEAARPALEGLLDALRSRLDAGGEATLDGIGRFRQADGVVAFEAEAALLSAVNARFAGLPSIAPPAAPPPPAPAPPAEEAAIPEEEVPPALFAVPLEPLVEDEELAAPALGGAQERPRPPLAEPDDAPIAPLPSAPTVIPAAASDLPPAEQGGPVPVEPEAVEDAFTTSIVAPLLSEAPELAPPVRDLSSDVSSDEPGPAEALPGSIGEPRATPSAPGDAMPSSDEAPGEAQPSVEAPNEITTEASPVDAAVDDDLDTLLTGVWAPSSPPLPGHPLGPASEPLIEDAEYDVVGERDEAEGPPGSSLVESLARPSDPPEEGLRDEGLPTEEQEGSEEVPPLVPAAGSSPEPSPEPAAPAAPPPFVAPPFAATLPAGAAPQPAPAPPAALPVAPLVPPRRAPTFTPATPPAPPERSRSWGLVFWLPLFAALLVLLVVFLRSRPRDEQPSRAAVAPAASPVQPTPDSTALAALDSTRDAPTDPASPPGLDPTAPASPPAASPAPSQPRPSSPAARPPERPAPPATQEETPPSATPPPSRAANLPAPFRGPGEVDPARGGATWVVGSGDRAGAERDASHYRRQGYRTGVLTGAVNGRTVHRVAVGQFASFQEAVRHRAALPRNAPADAWVLRFD